MGVIYLLIAFIALQIADAVTTYLVINKGGYEKNPVVAWGMKQIGLVPALMAYKGIGVAAGLVLYHFADHGGSYGLGFLTALYCWVVWNNYKAYRFLT